MKPAVAARVIRRVDARAGAAVPSIVPTYGSREYS